jgi:GT2 family glycosyltransferase
VNRLDIIIVNYKSEDCLFSCIESIYDSLNGMNVGVFVYDNSPDTSISSVERSFPEINLIRNKTNIGFAAAVNKGLRKSRAPYVMLLNPDTLVQNGLLSHICNYLDNNQNVGVVGPKILNPDGSIQGSARSFPTILTGLFGRTSLFSRLFPKNKLTRKNILIGNGDGKGPLKVDWVSGACMTVRRNAFNEVGPLDERFFMYWEDADWCRRMWEKRWAVVYFPQASVCHFIGNSSRSRPIKSSIAFHKSAYELFKKHTPWPQSILKPFVFAALTMHLYFNVFIYLVRRN